MNKNETTKYVGRGGWRGGGRPKTKGRAFTFRAVPEVEAILANEQGSLTDYINAAIKAYAERKE